MELPVNKGLLFLIQKWWKEEKPHSHWVMHGVAMGLTFCGKDTLAQEIHFLSCLYEVRSYL